ncbi:MAG: aminotransferase class I/II-fold pyridoxal phosphate-dependent enzyme, partial [Candidatus Ratteibacteria bacterium]
MENLISERTKLLKPSATLSLNRKAKQMKANGLDVINLTVGEPDFDTPEEIKEYAIKAMKDGFTKYTEEKGIKELREAICEKLEKENNLKYEPEEIVVSNGAKHSLFNIFLSILNPGDEVIIPVPYWVSYPAMVIISGGIPVFCKYNDKFKIDIDDLKEKISKKTKAIILNSPSNPTGIVYDKKEIEELAEVILSNRIICISDEVYEKIIFDKIHISIASLSKEIKDLTIVVNGVSKTFAMTGWRIGYIACKREIADNIAKIQGQTTSAPSSISQKAAYYAIKEGENLYKKMVEEFKKRRDFLVEKYVEDTLEIHEKLGLDFIRVGTVPSKNYSQEDLPKKIKENTYLYENKETKNWSILKYSPSSGQFFCVSSSYEKEGLDALEREIKYIKKKFEEKIEFNDKSIFEGWDKIVEKVGNKMAICFSAGIAIPLNPVFLEATILKPEWIEIYLDYQTNYTIEFIKEGKKHGADFILGGGDLADKNGPIYSPEIFKKFLLPRYKKILEVCKNLGLFYVYRSDGNTRPLWDIWFSEIGFDGYGEIDKSAGIELKELKEKYGNKITLIGNVDCAKTLVYGSKEDIYKEVEKCIRDAAESGGYILSSSN